MSWTYKGGFPFAIVDVSQMTIPPYVDIFHVLGIDTLSRLWWLWKSYKVTYNLAYNAVYPQGGGFNYTDIGTTVGEFTVTTSLTPRQRLEHWVGSPFTSWPSPVIGRPGVTTSGLITTNGVATVGADPPVPYTGTFGGPLSMSWYHILEGPQVNTPSYIYKDGSVFKTLWSTIVGVATGNAFGNLGPMFNYSQILPLVPKMAVPLKISMPREADFDMNLYIFPDSIYSPGTVRTITGDIKMEYTDFYNADD